MTFCVYMAVDGEAISLTAPDAVIADGRETRLAGLFDTHHQRLYRLARRLSTTPDEARDLVQETFLRIARAPRLMPPGVLSEEAWIVRAMANVARDGWRRRATHRRFVERGEDGTTRPTASDTEARLIARRTVWWALNQLPPRWRRAAIVLYELEGQSMSDIARMLGISAVTVRWHLSWGWRELARLLDTGNSE